MDGDDVVEAVGRLSPPALGKKAALERLIFQAQLAIWRGVTVDTICDCLVERGIRMSPDQLRSYLAIGTARRRPPATEAMIYAAGAVSATTPCRGRPGRRRQKSADDVPV